MSVPANRMACMLLAALLLAGVGCSNSLSPSYSTSTPPPGSTHVTGFDPVARPLVVRPLDATNPIRVPVAVIVTIYDEKGHPWTGERVEWMLEGAGHVLEVDEGGLLPGGGSKVNNHYAVSYTSSGEHRITRGNDDPSDDFMIRPGQTWCVITSAVEGETLLTVHAPGINDWQKNKVHVSYRWVDAEWSTPPASSAAPAGSAHVLTTSVFRHTDRQPLAGYRVRYHVIDGPPAVLMPANAPEAVAITDQRGDAAVQLAQVRPGPGSNRVAVEIVRPADSAGVIVSRSETRVDWQAPGLALAVSGPSALAVEQEGLYTIRLSNPGQLPVRTMTVRHVLPAGVEHVRSEPAAIVEGGQLIWTLGELAGRGSRELLVTLRQKQAVRVDHRVTVLSEEGLRDEKTIPTLGTLPGLKVSVTAPEGGTAGVPVNFRVSVTNSGSGPATNVLLRATLDQGLESESGANPIDLRLDSPLGTGQTRDFPLPVRARQPGTFHVRVSATADGNLNQSADASVTVSEARLGLTIAGPRVRYPGRALTWALEATNSGQAALAGAVVRLHLPTEVEFTSANEGGQLMGREVGWNLGGLRPGEKKVLQVTVNPVALTPGAAVHAQVTAGPEGGGAGSVRADAEATLEVRGVPAFRLEVVPEKNPLEVGSRSRYRIEVTNQGSLRGSGVQVTAIAPKQVRLVSANGPTAYRTEGDRIVFEPRDGLEAGQTWNYEFEVEATEVGDARFQAELRSSTLSEPVLVQQSTTIYSVRPDPPRP